MKPGRLAYLILLFQFYELFGQIEGKYNVLFIAVDDLNDWTGFLGGHPDALTPHMDELANSGMVFTNAHTASPSCNPSRLSIMTGFHPFSSGLYRNPNNENNQNLRSSPVTKNSFTLPEYLRTFDYYTMSRGKIYHTAYQNKETWNYWVGLEGSYGIPPEEDAYDNRLQWGPTDVPIEITPDFITANWTAEQLNKDYDRPFLLACGIFRPHLPWYVPRAFYDRFPIDSIDLPIIYEQDLIDVNQKASNDFSAISGDGKIREAARAYLANINYADSCIGVVLNALKESKYYDNTIVILWGDHGWHLGEKLHYKKFTLWEESTRVPLVVRIPGVTDNGLVNHEPVSLLDLYPTILSLCNLPPNTNNQGNDLNAMLLNEQGTEKDFALTTYLPGNYSLRTKRWRYISRKNGSIELYDHINDPNEHNNLWLNESFHPVIDSFQLVLDSLLTFAPPTSEIAFKKNTIPGTIQAENYDKGGNGVSYYDTDALNRGMQQITFVEPILFRNREGVDIFPCNDVGGGFHIMRIMPGEWLQYTLDKVDSGTYRLQFRIASVSNDSNIEVKLNGKFLTSIAVERTGGYSRWETIITDKFTLPYSETSVLKLEFSAGGFVLNELSFEKIVNNEEELATNIKAFPNPTDGLLEIDFDPIFSGKVKLINLTGNTLIEENIKNKLKFVLDLNKIMNGTYVVLVIPESGASAHQIIVKK